MKTERQNQPMTCQKTGYITDLYCMARQESLFQGRSITLATQFDFPFLLNFSFNHQSTCIGIDTQLVKFMQMFQNLKNSNFRHLKDDEKSQ